MSEESSEKPIEERARGPDAEEVAVRPQKQPEPRTITPHVLRLQYLVQEGITADLWKNFTDCARVIKVPGNTFRRHYNGVTFETSVVVKSSALVEMQLMLKKAPNCTPHPLVLIFKRWYDAGKPECWGTYDACRKKIGFKIHQLQQVYSYIGAQISVKLQHDILKMIGCMARKIEEVLPDHTISGITPIPEQSQTLAGIQEELPQEPVEVRQPTAPPTPAVVPVTDPLSAVFASVVQAAVRQVLEQALPGVAADQPKVIAPGVRVIEGDVYNRLLAGVAEGSDQNLDGIRFVLRRKNFLALKGKFTKQELRDTVLLIEELRRRFTLMSQVIEEDVRQSCYEQLGEQINELILAMLLLREVCPTQGITHIEHLREQFRTSVTNNEHPTEEVS